MNIQRVLKLFYFNFTSKVLFLYIDWNVVTKIIKNKVYADEFF